MLVKICGLSTAEDVLTAVDAGANAVGFVFAESPRKVSPAIASAISKTLSASVKRVAVMRHPSNDEWQCVLRDFQPHVLQTDAGDFTALDVPADIECWPVFREGGPTPSTTGTYLYEGRNSGHGEVVDWSVAAELATSGQMVLAGGLDAGNVGHAIRTVRPYGVDVSSAVESKRGRKDGDRIREFIRAARAAESEL